MGSDRYLAARLRTDGPIEKRSFVAALTREARSLLGDAGAAHLDLWVYDLDDESCVVGCRNGEVDRARAALACLTEVDGTRVAPAVVTVSGTIRTARERL